MEEKEKERHFKNALSNFGGMIEEDLEFQCTRCKHYVDDDICSAFTDGIPLEIVTEEFIHDKVHPEQENEIIFEPKG